MSRFVASKWVGFALSAILGALFLNPISALAQQATGTILGTVTDPQGGVVPGASVTATNTDTNFTRTVPTGDDGAYRLPSLPVGNYEVRVTKEGFQTNERKGLTLEVAQEAVVNVAMAVGATSQTVEVTEQAPLIDTTSASVGSVVDEQRVADLPLNGRNWSNLTLMQPGIAQSFLVVPSATGAILMAGNIITSNGAPVRSNNIMIDGAIMQSMMGVNGASASGNSLGIDGIQEYKVITSLFSAEYPLLMGSQTIIASKAGTNGFHGDAFEYLRNNSLDARNYFDLLDATNARGFGTDKSAAWADKRLPPYHRSDFGGSIGGPIQKDKTFFFAVYEGLREGKGLSITTNTLPAGCFNASGTFYGSINPTLPLSCVVAAAPSTLPAALMQYAPVQGGPETLSPVTIQLLTRGDNGGPLNSTAFPSGGLFPAPNVLAPGAPFNYTYPAIQLTDENYGQLRLDHTFSASDSIFGRYTHDQTAQLLPTAYQIALTHQNSVAQYATVSETHVFSPTLLQTLRFSYSQTLAGVITDANLGANPKSLVFQRGLGAVSPGSGVTGIGVAAPGNYNQRIFTVSDDYVLTRGKHAFKVGVLWNHFNNPQSGLRFQSQGSISFANLQQFFVGAYSSISLEPGTTDLQKTLSYQTLGFYLQDDYRLLPRLTLNLGLRYEFATNPNGPNNFAVRNLLTAGPPTYGTPGPAFLAGDASLHNVSPRFGFAWDVRGNGKTAVRGGTGIYYDVGNYGSLFFQDNFEDLPHTWQWSFTNFNTNPLVATPSGTGLLDPLSATRTGCGQISNPLYPPCPQASVQYHPAQPTLAQWNLSVDQQLPWNMALDVSYIGSVGWHLWSQEDTNYVNATIAPNGAYIPLQTDARGEPSYCVQNANGTCQFTNASSGLTSTQQATAISGLAFQRINPFIGGTSDTVSTGRSWYNSLQAVVNKRISHGLQLQSAFTWSRLVDNGLANVQGDGSENIVVPDGPNGNDAGNLDYARSSYNITRNYRFNAVYHFGQIHKDAFWTKFANGWWTGAILALQSGYPFTVSVSGANRMLATPAIGTDIPNRAASFNSNTVILGKPTKWFDPTQFALQSAGVNGSAGRNELTGPSLRNLDWSFNKDTKASFLGEAGEIQLRAEIFNIFNTANFALPSGSVYTLASGAAQASTAPGQIGSAGLTPLSTAGLISSTVTSSRQIQFALKLVF